MSKDISFQERYFKEYDLSGRVRLSIILSMIFYPSFIVLDAVAFPEWLETFVAIRVVVVLLNIMILVAFRYTDTSRGYLNLGMLLLIVDTLGIALMVQLMGGFMSSYYQGLTLVLMCMMTLLPFPFKESTIVSSVIYGSYLIPSVFNMQRGTLQGSIVFNNLFFLTSIVVIGLLASRVMYNIRRRALNSCLRLEATTKKLRESNLKLKSLDELKTQFFANVNHELRTPLTLMLAPLEPMMEGKMGRATAKQRETLITVRRNGFKLLRLINNLLDLTKLEVGKMRLKIKAVDFIEFLNSLLASVKPLADRKEIKLYFQHPSQNLKITIDPDHFDKAVLNLLSNAIKFTPENGRITVYLEEKKKSVSLIVEDTGKGIPESMLESIFDRFSQVDGSLSRSHEGTGIGLSLVKEIVWLHGGKIHAESQVEKGSRFIIDLKKGDGHFNSDVLDRRHEDQAVSLKKRATDTEPPRVQDIVSDFHELQLVDLDKVDTYEQTQEKDFSHEHLLLVIDDNPEVLKLMQVLLADEFDLDPVLSAKEGLKRLKDKSHDLVLCDVMMPDMDGHAFCKRMRDDIALKHTPIILVTARSGPEMLVEGMKSGADDYISKPFNSEELRSRIRSLLRMRRAEAELSQANRNLKMRTGDLVKRQRSLFLSTVKSLVSALDAKDNYTRHHSARVTEFTLRIAKKMGFSSRELEDLELASILHDVGKIAVPEIILNKDGKLTDEEFGYIKEHPARGEDILKPVIELNEVSRIVRSHHERYDGKGYPDGLNGQSIPLGARIMAVADTYDAITSDRPYRKGKSHNFAVKEIVKCSGSQFDPEVLEHFIEICEVFSEIGEPKEYVRSF